MPNRKPSRCLLTIVSLLWLTSAALSQDTSDGETVCQKVIS
jgi:hypothetical protein